MEITVTIETNKDCDISKGENVSENDNALGENIDLVENGDAIEEHVADYKNPLYHYTSVEALFNILKGRELWLSRADCVNDGKEVMYFVESVRKEIAKQSGNEKIQKLKLSISNLVFKRSYQFPFTMSFTSLKDDAAQWERYAESARGVCIEFNHEALAKVAHSLNAVLDKVNYGIGRNIQESENFKLIKTYMKSVTDNEIEKLNDWIYNINKTAPLYKHESFRAESEYRLIVTDTGILYRENQASYELRRGVIVPVYKVKIDDVLSRENISVDDLLESVALGPKSVQNPSVLENYCLANKFNSLAKNIVKSECPLR